MPVQPQHLVIALLRRQRILPKQNRAQFIEDEIRLLLVDGAVQPVHPLVRLHFHIEGRHRLPGDGRSSASWRLNSE